MATVNCLRHLKKKKVTRDQRLLCAIQNETGDVVLLLHTGNDLGVMGFFFFFFPENCDKTDQVGAEIADRLKLGILSLY